jgi:hypothetical protein
VGNVREYGYDLAGQLTSVRDELSGRAAAKTPPKIVIEA